MGIQRFGHRMRDHADNVVLGSFLENKGGSGAPPGDLGRGSDPVQQQPSPSCGVGIVDGPGLAHYIYYGLCDLAKDRAVTYQGCVDATTLWLDRMRKYGLGISAIFFDGALPSTKREVRINRLQNYIFRLQAFKQAAGKHGAGNPQKNLPPPPFLVFAIVEELLRHPVYGALTYVVPGEADPYCVAAAQASVAGGGRERGTTTIFSDDADLMVYDVGDQTRIVPFRDLDECVIPIDGGVVRHELHGDVYRPAAIVKQRSHGTMGDLVQPAYYMSLDLHCGLDRALRLAAEDADLHQDEGFRAFSRTFRTEVEREEWGRLREETGLKEGYCSRDSRISELVDQLRAASRGDQSGGLRMYLPFISDDPSRSTAWRVGEDVRVAAYTILLQCHPHDRVIQEYRRSGSRVASCLLEALSGEDLAGVLGRVERAVGEAFAGEDGLEGVDGWRVLVLGEVLRYLQMEGLARPTVEEARKVVMNGEVRKWHVVHFAGQYQAAYYSLRLLQQCVAYAQGEGEGEGEGDGEGEEGSRDVHRLLKGLPRISTFFDAKVGVRQDSEGVKWDEVLVRVLEEYTAEEVVM